MSEETAKPGDTIRGKWMMDGATTLLEAAELCQQYAQWLRELHTEGWTLAAPIADDYGILVDPSGNAGAEDDDDEEEDGSLIAGRDVSLTFTQPWTAPFPDTVTRDGLSATYRVNQAEYYVDEPVDPNLIIEVPE